MRGLDWGRGMRQTACISQVAVAPVRLPHPHNTTHVANATPQARGNAPARLTPEPRPNSQPPSLLTLREDLQVQLQRAGVHHPPVLVRVKGQPKRDVVPQAEVLHPRRLRDVRDEAAHGDGPARGGHLGQDRLQHAALAWSVRVWGPGIGAQRGGVVWVKGREGTSVFTVCTGGCPRAQFSRQLSSPAATP